MRFYISYLVHVLKIEVCHAYLLPLEYKGCASKREKQGCKGLRALGVETLVVAEAGNTARLVVVFEVKSVPVQGVLPLCECFEKAVGRKGTEEPLYKEAVGLHVLERENRVELGPLGGDEVVCHFGRYKDRFAHGIAIVRRENLAVKTV